MQNHFLSQLWRMLVAGGIKGRSKNEKREFSVESSQPGFICSNHQPSISTFFLTLSTFNAILLSKVKGKRTLRGKIPFYSPPENHVTLVMPKQKKLLMPKESLYSLTCSSSTRIIHEILILQARKTEEQKWQYLGSDWNYITYAFWHSVGRPQFKKKFQQSTPCLTLCFFIMSGYVDLSQYLQWLKTYNLGNKNKRV